MHWISSPALYHCATVTSAFHLWTILGIQLWCRGIGDGIVLIWPVRDFLFGHIIDLYWMFSGSLVLPLYHCTTVTSGFHLWQFQVFNSGAEGLTVVVMLWLGPVRDFLFACTRILELGKPLDLLVQHSTTVPWLLLLFTSDNLQVFNSSAEGMMVVFFGFGVWEISFCLHHDSSGDLWISSAALYNSTTVTSGFNLWKV